MKQVINDKLIKRNKRIGNITSITGIAILVAGLILNINPDATRTIISFVALIVGFIVAQISTYFITRFGRSPRSDEIIEKNLSQLNNRYTFYVYSSPVPMLLTSPHGIWIPIPIMAGGELYYDNKWKQRGGNFLLKFLGQESLGKPEKDIETQENKVRNFLDENFEQGLIPPIKSILVSLHPNATIGNIEGAPNQIVQVDALRRTIRKIDRKSEEEVSQETLDKIHRLLKAEL